MKKRKDSFWGIHCDFHAKPEMGVIGKTLCEEDIRTICRELQLDFWQIDCKGHFGWVSYPTALGNAMPEFAVDTLEMWRRVTKEEEVGLYLHYSGVIDEKYCREHPSECVMHADGSIKYSVTRCNGKYVDDLLIPQFTEAYEKYCVDGFWVDGECWGTQCDYRLETRKAFEKETGICLNNQWPSKPGDPYFNEYREYHRELFRKYVRHYIDTLHEKCPGLQITSNWLYSEFMPEKVTIDVDFLSGDNDPADSLRSCRLAARALAQHQKPWDLMGVGQCFNGSLFDLLPKHPTQMLQLAASTISMGGGFQIGVSLLFDGSPNMPALLNLKPVAEFMRAREAWCFRGKPVPQAAMFLSAYDHYLEGDALFQRGKIQGKVGLCSLLCDSGQSLEIISEYKLKENCSRYSMIAVPEILEGLEPDTVQELLDYAKNGGNLLLTGTNTCRIFAEAGAPYEVLHIHDEVNEYHYLAQINGVNDQKFWTMGGNSYGAVIHPVEIAAKAPHEVLAHTFYFVKHPLHPFAEIIEYGKGKIAVIGADIGAAYHKASQHLHRELIQAIAKKLYTPLVQLESACGMLELVCLEKEDKLMIQLVNANGNHSNHTCDTEDVIPPVLDIQLSIQSTAKPEKIMLQPENRELPFEYRDGRAYIKIDRMDMHAVVVL